MEYLTINTYEPETHPWDPYIPKKADKLLLGTFPTHSRNRGTVDFFYPNPNNGFWQIIFELAELDPGDAKKNVSVALRKKALKQLNLGVTDICRKVLRQSGSSNDQALFPIEFTNILLLLEKHPRINTLVVTSRSKSSSALAWLHQYCSLNGCPFKFPKGPLPQSAIIRFGKRTIAVEIVPSPSGQCRIPKDRKLQMYRNALLKNKQGSEWQ